jgi:hypothetical protein
MMHSMRCVHRAATICAIAAALSGCARVEEGEVARNDLVSLIVVGVNGVRTLRLDAAPGARINALLPPTVEFSPTERLQLSSSLVTADSSYFTASPTAALGEVSGKRGVLRASVCPAAVKVCKFVELPVALP